MANGNGTGQVNEEITRGNYKFSSGQRRKSFEFHYVYFGWRVHQPLNVDDQLNEHREKEKEGLVRCRQVDSAVQTDQEDVLDEKGREDDGKGQTHAESDGGTGGNVRGNGDDGTETGAEKQPQEQHLSEEEVPPGGTRPPRFAQNEHFEPGDQQHGESREHQQWYDPTLSPEHGRCIDRGEGRVHRSVLEMMHRRDAHDVRQARHAGRRLPRRDDDRCRVGAHLRMTRRAFLCLRGYYKELGAHVETRVRP